VSDAHFIPTDKEREALLAALAAVYANTEHLREFLNTEFAEIAGNVNFNDGSNTATDQTLEQVGTGVVAWERFLRVVRRKRTDSSQLSAIVHQILLRGSLAVLSGRMKLISGLEGAERAAFEDCQPPFTEDSAGRPPIEEGQRVAWYAARLVPAGRLSQPGAIPVLWFVELIRQAVASTNATMAEELNRWIEQTAERVAANEEDRKQILEVTRRAALRRPARRQAPAAVTNEWVLYFQIRPARDVVGTHGPYGLKAWLMLSDGSGARSVWVSKEPWKRERVARLLSSRPTPNEDQKPLPEIDDEPSPLDVIRDSLADEGVHYSDVSIEVVLPSLLVWCEPDQSPITADDGLGRTVLGAAHVVTVRVFERQRRLAASMPRRIQNLFSTRLSDPVWLVRDRRPDKPPDDEPPANALKLLWVDEDSPMGDDLTARIADEEFLGCVVGLNPLDMSEAKRAEFLQSITGANVPIIVWSRKCPPEGTTLWNCFHELLHTQSLIGCARQVFEQRQRAHQRAGGKWHLGRYLSFVWEDPRRLTPDLKSSRAGTPQ
jgi:hypothetical protein